MNSRVLHSADMLEFYAGMTKAYASIPATDWQLERDKLMLEMTIKLATPGYTCLRPPGAAGAILNGSVCVLGCAEPAVGLTCKELGECEIEDGHCVRTIHAEVNAIVLAARLGISTRRWTMYSILKPCYNCTKVIIAAGISRIVYAGAAYDEPRTNKMLKLANVECSHADIGLEYGNVK